MRSRSLTGRGLKLLRDFCFLDFIFNNIINLYCVIFVKIY